MRALIILVTVCLAVLASAFDEELKRSAKRAFRDGDVMTGARLLEQYVYEEQALIPDRIFLAKKWTELGIYGKAVRELKTAYAAEPANPKIRELWDQLDEILLPNFEPPLGTRPSKPDPAFDPDVLGSYRYKRNTAQYPRDPDGSVRLKKKSRDSFFEYLSSEEFMNTYWEKQPVLMRTGGAFNKLVGWPEVEQEYYGERLDEMMTNAPNVFQNIQGNFYIPPLIPGGHVKIWHGSDFLDMLGNTTLILNDVTTYMANVAELNVNMSMIFGLPSNTNLYISALNLSETVNPHTDMQSTFIVQLEGRKRWIAWNLTDYKLPIQANQILGKVVQAVKTTAELGEPMLDVILHPGDVLYVPRGLIHATSTVVPYLSDDPHNHLLLQPSYHLTVGLEVQWSIGIGFFQLPFLGGFLDGQDTLQANSVTHLWMNSRTNSVNRLAVTDYRLRKAAVWRDRTGMAVMLRGMLRSIVDDVLEDSTLIESIRFELKRNVNRWNHNLTKMILEQRKFEANARGE